MKMTFHIKWVLLYISVLVLTKYKNDNRKYEKDHPKFVLPEGTVLEPNDILPQFCFGRNQEEQPTSCRRRGLECRVYNRDRCQEEMAKSVLIVSKTEQPLYSTQCAGKTQKYCLQLQGKCQWVESAFSPLCGSVPIVMDSSNRNYPVFYFYFIALFLYCCYYCYTRSRLSAGLKEKCYEKEIKRVYESRTISPDYEHIAGTKGLSWTDTYFDRDDSVIAVFDMDTSLYNSEILQSLQFFLNLLYFLSIFFILLCFFLDVDVDDGTPLSLGGILPIYIIVLLCHVIVSVCNGRKWQFFNPKMHTAVTTEGVVILRKFWCPFIDLLTNVHIPFTRIREVQQHKRINHTVRIDLLAKEKEASLCDRTLVVVNYLVDSQAFVKLVEAMKLKHNCDEEVPLVASVVE